MLNPFDLNVDYMPLRFEIKGFLQNSAQSLSSPNPLCVFEFIYSSRSKQNSLSSYFYCDEEKKNQVSKLLSHWFCKRWSYLDQHFYMKGSSTAQRREMITKEAQW